VQNSRPSTGKTSIAQLFLEIPENAEEVIRKKADSLYQLLKAGADFAQLAYQFSNDNASYQNGGELLPFQAGTYDPAFEAVVSKLDKPGAISAPY
ncbi:peptidyl-prolyl cis-trans isomerase, partial [Flavihumibacter sediminis]|nr:peptidyl-prolyl cis-trans isomerase [Flavihumibacter sediminis]